MRSRRPGSRARARTRGCRTSPTRRGARRGVRDAVGRRHLVPFRGALRAGGGALGLRDDPHLQPGPARAGVRRAVDDRLRRRPHRARATSRTRWRAIEDFVRPIAEAGVIPVGMGGDHSVTLAELRAVASVHGPLGLLHFDSHTDLWDSYNGRPYSHGTMFRRAIEEGILDPARTLQVGMRGPLYGADDEAIPGELGVETIPWHELAELAPGRARGARPRPARRRPGVPHARRRLRRPRLLPRHRHAGGGRADELRGAPVPARLHRTCPSSASTWWRSPRPTTARARSPPCSRPTRSSRCCR